MWLPISVTTETYLCGQQQLPKIALDGSVYGQQEIIQLVGSTGQSLLIATLPAFSMPMGSRFGNGASCSHAVSMDTS